MSDPVTNVEIEDVLTSIRRLIGQGGAAGPAGAADVVAPHAVPGGRLVLTPALRVVEPRFPVAERQADNAKGAPDQGSGVLHHTAQPGPGDVPPWSGRVEGVAMRLRDRGEAGAGPESGAESARMRAEEAPVFRSRQGAPLHSDRAMSADGEPAFRHSPATEAAPAANGPDRGALARPDSVARSAAEATGLRGIDEVMLRRIVAEMIQQELQGALGERITHNLRRLVRREIARAMDGDEDP